MISVYTLWCKDNLKIPVGKWFSLGVPWNPPPPPLCTNGSAGYLMQLSVKTMFHIIDKVTLNCLISSQLLHLWKDAMSFTASPTAPNLRYNGFFNDILRASGARTFRSISRI